MSAEPSEVTDISGTSAGAAPAAKKAATPKRPASEAKPSGSSFAEGLPSWPNVDVTKYFEESRERLKEAFEQVNGSFEGVRATVRDSNELWLKSHSAFLGGMRDLSERVFEGAQNELDRCHDCFKAATEAKDVSELMQVQADFWRESLEAQMEQGRAIAEAASSVFKSAYEPLQSQLGTLFEKSLKGGR